MTDINVSDERLDRILRSLDAVDDMLSHAAEVAAGRAEGTDSTGTVRVVLDPAGVAERIELADGWRRAVAGTLGAAVGDAARAAAGVQSAAFNARLGEIGYLDRLEQLDAWLDGVTDEVPPGVPARPSPLPVPMGGTTADILASVEASELRRNSAPAEPAGATGFAGFGKIAVTFAIDGSLRCAVDEQWLARRDDAEVSDALNHAIGAARIELTDLKSRDRR